MRVLYLDCFSGISGDMTLAALVDAGADRNYVESQLASLPTEPFHLAWKQVTKQGVSALKVDVIEDPDHPPASHRTHAAIVDLIESSTLSDKAKAIGLAIFQKIAVAEAKIHNMPIEDVHFHEVGAIDSIADALGVALALESLAIDKVICAPVPLGSGRIRCDHGLYPVPAPATLEMMKGIPLAASPYAMEMTTPTGAGIVSALASSFSDSLPAMTIDAIGYGAGTRNLPEQPNVLRVIIGTLAEAPAKASRFNVRQHAHDHH